MTYKNKAVLFITGSIFITLSKCALAAPSAATGFALGIAVSSQHTPNNYLITDSPSKVFRVCRSFGCSSCTRDIVEKSCDQDEIKKILWGADDVCNSLILCFKKH